MKEKPDRSAPRRSFHLEAGKLMLLIFLASAYLAFARLDNTCFWDDEAQVGIIARNLLSTGKLTGWDGRNLFAYRNGTLLRQDLSPRNPPLDYLATALSFRIFGQSTWAGRFPFVVAGLLGLGIFRLLLRQEFPGQEALHVYAFALLGLSTIFLLNIRQCRYYALSLLFSLCTYWIFRQCLVKKQLRYFLFLPVAAILLFLSNYLLGAAFLPALISIYLFFHRGELAVSEWRKAMISIAIFVLVIVPYAIHFQIWDRPDMPVQESWLAERAVLFWWNIRELNVMGCMPWPFFALLIYFVWRHWRKEPWMRPLVEWSMLVFMYVLFLAIMSPQSSSTTSMADIRYLILAVPFLAGVVGGVLWYIHSVHGWGKIIAVILMVTLVTTNLLTMGPPGVGFRWLLPAYAKEVHQPYPTSYRLVSEYLNQNAVQDDLVLAFPEYCNYPLMFYLGNKVRFCCLLDRNTPLDAEVVGQLDAPLLIDKNFPDWLIFFGAQPIAKKAVEFFSRSHILDGVETEYTYRLEKTLDVFWVDTSRPELFSHSFGPVTKFDRGKDAVYVLRRLEDQ